MAIVSTRNRVTLAGAQRGHLKAIIAPGTSTLTIGQSGSVISTEGASAHVTFTLPAVATSAGIHYWFQNAENYNMIIAAPSGTLTTFNNAGATSAAFQSANELVGGGAFVICDGSKWHLQLMTYDGADQAVTVA